MIDMTTIAQAVGSLNAIKTLISSAVDVRDESKRVAATNKSIAEISELIGKLLSAQIAMAHSNAEHEAVLREKRDLEEKLLAIQKQNADFERYELKEIAIGVLGYIIKPGHENGEPKHWICSRCRNEGKKSILQLDKSKHAHSLTCPICATRHPTGTHGQIQANMMR